MGRFSWGEITTPSCRSYNITYIITTGSTILGADWVILDARVFPTPWNEQRGVCPWKFTVGVDDWLRFLGKFWAYQLSLTGCLIHIGPKWCGEGRRPTPTGCLAKQRESWTGCGTLREAVAQWQWKWQWQGNMWNHIPPEHSLQHGADDWNSTLQQEEGPYRCSFARHLPRSAEERLDELFQGLANHWLGLILDEMTSVEKRGTLAKALAAWDLTFENYGHDHFSHTTRKRDQLCQWVERGNWSWDDEAVSASATPWHVPHESSVQ